MNTHHPVKPLSKMQQFWEDVFSDRPVPQAALRKAATPHGATTEDRVAAMVADALAKVDLSALREEQRQIRAEIDALRNPPPARVYPWPR